MFRPVASCIVLVSLVGCGGGNDESTVAEGVRQPRESALAVSIAQRIVAARTTAQSSTNACAAIQPFYWEIGSTTGRLTSGSVNGSSTATYSATTVVDLGSASKWIYGAYVAQKRAGLLTDSDIKHLTLRSGYNSLSECYPKQTVGQCFRYGDNATYTAENDGLFAYNGGHLQKHAVLEGLGAMTRQQLASEIKSQVGTELALRYDIPVPSGGAAGSASTYAAFLRKLMNSSLQLGAMLGSGAVCTSPQLCPLDAVFSPTPPNEVWHYSLGHWIEDDPIVGDGSFSSPGTKGFYPWIDSTKNLYGIISRQADPSNSFTSVSCGRQIRMAWKTGVAQ